MKEANSLCLPPRFYLYIMPFLARENNTEDIQFLNFVDNCGVVAVR